MTYMLGVPIDLCASSFAHPLRLIFPSVCLVLLSALSYEWNAEDGSVPIKLLDIHLPCFEGFPWTWLIGGIPQYNFTNHLLHIAPEYLPDILALPKPLNVSCQKDWCALVNPLLALTLSAMIRVLPDADRRGGKTSGASFTSERTWTATSVPGSRNSLNFSFVNTKGMLGRELG